MGDAAIVLSRLHELQGFYEGALGVRQELEHAVERLVWLGVQDVQDRPEEELIRGPVPVGFLPLAVGVDQEIGERISIEVRLEGYTAREIAAVERAARMQREVIPTDFDYAKIAALSREAREKFTARRPRTLAAAARIPGITPSDVAIVGVFIHRLRNAAAS